MGRTGTHRRVRDYRQEESVPAPNQGTRWLNLGGYRGLEVGCPVDRPEGQGRFERPEGALDRFGDLGDREVLRGQVGQHVFGEGVAVLLEELVPYLVVDLFPDEVLDRGRQARGERGDASGGKGVDAAPDP